MFWFLVFPCLSIFELFDMKLVLKRFHELVSYDLKFKRIFDLSNSTFEEVLWNKNIKKNLWNVNQVTNTEFRDDPMLQLYRKYTCINYFVILPIVKEVVVQMLNFVECVLEFMLIF